MNQGVLLAYIMFYLIGQIYPAMFDKMNLMLLFIVAILSSFKIVALSPNEFKPNTVLVIQVVQNLYIGLYSNLEWYKMAIVQLSLQLIQITHWCFVYGVQNIPLDVFLHLGFSYLLIVSIIRKKEHIDKKNFNLWRRVDKYKTKLNKILQLLQEGVLIIEYRSQSPKIAIYNRALVRIIKGYQKLDEFNQDHDYLDSCQESKFQYSQNNSSKECQYDNLEDLFSGINVAEEFNQERKSKQKYQSLLKYIDQTRKSQQLKPDQSKHFLKLQPNNISVELSVITLAQDNQILFLFKDISVFKKLQKTKTQDQFTNVFINSTAHNIFTPINGMIGVKQLLEETIPENHEAMRYCGLLNNCLQNLIYSTRNIIKLSKIRLKKCKVKIEPISFPRIADELFSIYTEEIKMKKLQIKKSIQRVLLDHKIQSDVLKLKQILFNIMSNSFKYTQHGFISLVARIVTVREIQSKLSGSEDSENDHSNLTKSESESLMNDSQNSLLNSESSNNKRMSSMINIIQLGHLDDQYLQVSIVDSGIGIEQRESGNLFNLFGKVKFSDEQISQNGLGLGLTVSNLLCEELGGKMFLEWSHPGKGSKFTVYLPVKLQDPDALEEIKESDESFSELSFVVPEPKSKYRSKEIYKNQHERGRIGAKIQMEFEVENLDSLDIDEAIPQIFKEEYKDEIHFHQNRKLERSPKQIPALIEQIPKPSPSINRSRNQFNFSLTPSQQNSSSPFIRFTTDKKHQNNQFQNHLCHSEQSMMESNFYSQEEARILIVDDCSFNIEILQMMLSHLFGLQADSVMSGLDAIDKVREKICKIDHEMMTKSSKNRKENMYDLIIMDINMPVMDGVEATKQLKNLLKQNHLSTRVVAHTALPEDMFTTAEQWFDDFLAKPLSADQLATILQEANIIQSGNDSHNFN
eukprot:403332893